jgi:hypothetical protein
MSPAFDCLVLWATWMVAQNRPILAPREKVICASQLGQIVAAAYSHSPEN